MVDWQWSLEIGQNTIFKPQYWPCREDFDWLRGLVGFVSKTWPNGSDSLTFFYSSMRINRHKCCRPDRCLTVGYILPWRGRTVGGVRTSGAWRSNTVWNDVQHRFMSLVRIAMKFDILSQIRLSLYEEPYQVLKFNFRLNNFRTKFFFFIEH